ncbi:MAG: hypothetical protein ACK4YF_04905 [Exilispira sp.]
MCFFFIVPFIIQPIFYQDFTTNNSIIYSNFLYININESQYFYIDFNLNEKGKESLFSRAENLFFLLLPLLYFYLSNIVKLSQILNYGYPSSQFNIIENRYIWFSIIAITFNIIIHDYF